VNIYELMEKARMLSEPDPRIRHDRFILGDRAFDMETGRPVPMSDAFNPWSEST